MIKTGHGITCVHLIKNFKQMKTDFAIILEVPILDTVLITVFKNYL